MKPLILILLGLVVLGAVASILLIYTVFSPPEKWSLTVSPQEIVIKGPVGSVVTREVKVECISGRGVVASLTVSNLTNATVSPQYLTLNKGDYANATLTVKISKLGKEEGELTVAYGNEEEKVKIKVIGLPPGTLNETQRQDNQGQQGGSGGTGTKAWLNITIYADVVFSGETSGTLQNIASYTSSFTTHYIYSFRLCLTKKSSTKIGDVYSGILELIEVSKAYTRKFYYQVSQQKSTVAEVNITIEGYINRMPEGQSLGTTVEITIDAQGHIIDINVGYGEWYLGELTGTRITTIKSGDKVTTSTTKVTKGFWLSTAPLEALIKALKPKIDDTVMGTTETSTVEYPEMLGQFYGCEPSEPITIDVEGTIVVLKT